MEADRSELISSFPEISSILNSIPESVMQYSNIVSLKRNHILLHQGERVRNVYLVCSGSVLISSCSSSGGEKIVVFAGKGELVGEMEALLQNRNIIYSAKCYTDCRLLEIPADIFQRWVDTDGNICRTIVYILAKKLMASSVSTIQYQNKTAEARLRALLSQKAPGAVRETRTTLAEACGVSERTIYRAVNSLAGKGFLTVRGRKIILTKEQLRRLNESGP